MTRKRQLSDTYKTSDQKQETRQNPQRRRNNQYITSIPETQNNQPIDPSVRGAMALNSLAERHGIFGVGYSSYRHTQQELQPLHPQLDNQHTSSPSEWQYTAQYNPDALATSPFWPEPRQNEIQSIPDSRDNQNAQSTIPHEIRYQVRIRDDIETGDRIIQPVLPRENRSPDGFHTTRIPRVEGQEQLQNQQNEPHDNTNFTLSQPVYSPTETWQESISSSQNLDQNTLSQDNDSQPSKKKGKGKRRQKTPPEEILTGTQYHTDNLFLQQDALRQQLTNRLNQTDMGSSYISIAGLNLNYNDLTAIEEDSSHKTSSNRYSESSERSTPGTGLSSRSTNTFRPHTYEEWRNTEEGRDPHFKPVQSPGGQIYAYDKKDFQSFKEKTAMEQRPINDQIDQGPLDRVIAGKQKGAGKGKHKWTSPHPETQQKLQKHLDKDNKRNTKKLRDLKNDEDKYIEHLDKEKNRIAKWREDLKNDEDKYIEHLNKQKDSNSKWREDLKKDKDKYTEHLNKQKDSNSKWYNNLKKNEDKYTEHLDKERNRSAKWREDLKKDKDKYTEHLNKQKANSAKRYNNLKKNEDKYIEHLDKLKANSARWRKDMRDPDKRTAFFDRRYNRVRERYERAIHTLDKKIDAADTLTDYNKSEKEKEQLTKAWNTFQEKHQADLNKLEKLINTYNEVFTALEEYATTPQPRELHNQQLDPLLLEHMQSHLNTLDTQILDYFTENDEITYLLDYFEETHGLSKTNNN